MPELDFEQRLYLFLPVPFTSRPFDIGVERRGWQIGSPSAGAVLAVFTASPLVSWEQDAELLQVMRKNPGDERQIDLMPLVTCSLFMVAERVKDWIELARISGLLTKYVEFGRCDVAKGRQRLIREMRELSGIKK